MKSGYRDLGLELVSLEDNHSRYPKWPPMAKEKRDGRARDPFKTLLEEALVRQRNKMMDNFDQILQRLPMEVANECSTRNHFASVTPFKV